MDINFFGKKQFISCFLIRNLIKLKILKKVVFLLRNGQFDNLQWNKLADTHRANWESLEIRYRLPLQQVGPSRSLDLLAMQAVKLCREYLFTSYGCAAGWETGLTMGVLPASALEQHLVSALCDHLIVTFAHRFLCDNLEHRSLKECLNNIFTCRSESAPIYKPGKDKAGNPKMDRDQMRNVKYTFIRSKTQTCTEFDEKIDSVVAFYRQQIDSASHTNVGDRYARIRSCRWMITRRKKRIISHGRRRIRSRRQRKLESRKLRFNNHMTLLVPQAVDYLEIKEDLELIEKERIDSVSKRYAAPNWMYSIAMACGWINSPLAASSDSLVFGREYGNKKSVLYKLTQFLGSGEWGPMLFRKADFGSKRIAYPVKPTYSQIVPSREMQEEMNAWQLQSLSSLMELRMGMDGQFFAAVPYVDKQLYMCSLPPQSYTIQGISSRYEIPCDVQQMFNSYLVERTFHGYASTVVIDRIRNRQGTKEFESRRDQYQKLPSVVRLRAPLVHRNLIQIADSMIQKTTAVETAIPWLDQFVDYWNRLALPLLEESFLRSVWHNYQGNRVDAILSAIMEALTHGKERYRRCDRLNLYRLMPIKRWQSPPKEDDGIFNEVMKNSFLAGLGCKLGQTDGRWIDPGRAMAFDGSLKL